MTEKRKVTATSKYFNSKPYKLNVFYIKNQPKTFLIDYDELEKDAILYRPKLIIAGASAYSREIDYSRFRKVGYLLSDL